MLEFNIVAEYAKEMEHLLGEMRDQTKQTNPDNIGVMLESVEFIRAMIKQLQNKEVLDDANAAIHRAKMHAAIV